MVHLHCPGVLEVIVNGRRHFGGDFYSFRRAPIVFRVLPGEHVLHQIDVRLIRDVRAMGGNDANIDVQLEVQAVKTDVELVQDSLLISDIVNGKLASDLGSVIIRNNGEKPAIVTGREFSGNVIDPTISSKIRFILTIIKGRDEISTVESRSTVRYRTWSNQSLPFSDNFWQRRYSDYVC
jgi:hypothetical protein